MVLLRADAGLETIERMLSGFGEAISIAEASVTADFIPFGRRLLVRSEARAEALQALSCASSESDSVARAVLEEVEDGCRPATDDGHHSRWWMTSACCLAAAASLLRRRF